MAPKIPLILVTGFLGSGKTSFLANYLSSFSEGHRIAVVQNEFAPSSIDSEVLREENKDFILRELDKGSIFCACLFSSFKNTLVELAQNETPDAVLVEATGIADPIAVAQVMEDERVNAAYYLQKIVTIVDSCRFLSVLEHIVGVRHQIEVADYIFLNKTDLVESALLEKIEEKIIALNPFASIIKSSYGRFTVEELDANDPAQLVSRNVAGPLTRCGQGNYISRVFKTSLPTSLEKVKELLDTFDCDMLRLKGYVTDKERNSFMIQYVPGQTEIIPCKRPMGRTELIYVGFKEPDFGILQ